MGTAPWSSSKHHEGVGGIDPESGQRCSSSSAGSQPGTVCLSRRAKNASDTPSAATSRSSPCDSTISTSLRRGALHGATMFASSGRILGVLGPVERDMICWWVGRVDDGAHWSAALQGRRVRDSAVTVWGCRDGAPINIALYRLRTGKIVASGASLDCCDWCCRSLEPKHLVVCGNSPNRRSCSAERSQLRGDSAANCDKHQSQQSRLATISARHK